MDEMNETVRAALDTVLCFEDSLTEVEAKTGNLFHMLEEKNIDPEPLYEIFKVFSQIRFHLAEAHEYQSLLNNRQSKNTTRGDLPAHVPAPEHEESLVTLVAQQAADGRKSLYKRLESRLAALVKGQALALSKMPPLRKILPQPRLPQPQQPPLA